MSRTQRARLSVLIIVLAALLSLSSLGSKGSPLLAQSAACSPVTATITAPFTFDGAGTFCWQSSNLGSNINSWNVASLTVNGVNFTNTFAFASDLPPKINGFWYVSYTGNFAWSHFEAVGTGGPTATTGPTSTPTRTPTVGGPTNTPTRTPTG